MKNICVLPDDDSTHFDVEEELVLCKELLARKNRRLAELYEAGRQFVDHVSHQFRTPLTVLREYCSIMREQMAGPITDQQRDHLDVMAWRIDDLALMVDDMLDTGALEAGLLTIWRRRASVAEMIDHACSLPRRRAAARKVSLTKDIDAELPEMFCDPDKTGRVVNNLLVHAIQVTPAGGNVTLWAHAEPQSSQVVIGVTDSGPGIHPVDQNIIFEPFQQIEHSTLESTKGFGLGLNVAKQLVHLNLGTIEVESHLGRGSTFRFTVPLANPAALFRLHLDRLEALHERTCAVSPGCQSRPGRASPLAAGGG